MAKKGSLNFFEIHVEKIALGLTVAFAIYVAVHYMMGPNKVEFRGQTYGPENLDEAIAQRADSLKTAYDRATPEIRTIEDFRKQLVEEFQTGIYGRNDDEGVVPVPRSLPRVVAWGQATPELDAETPVRDVQLVTPLPPSPPMAKTGISLVRKSTPQLSTDPAVRDQGDEVPAEETCWVSVASFFPKEAQENEMTSAGYEGYRAKVYLVGVDVERQAITADGQWSEWQSVEPSVAMPKVDLPEPIIDDRSGEIHNQSDLDRSFELVKANQRTLAQPTFYNVVEGDTWTLPTEEDKEEPEESDDDRRPKPGPRPGQPGLPPPGGPGPGPGDPGPGPNEGPSLRQKLSDARRAIQQGNLAEAERLANEVESSPDASSAEKKRAASILKQVESRRSTGAPNTSGTSSRESSQTLVTDPRDNTSPAVWFHDDSVEPGKTYRYRMRARLWNRYVGRQSMLRDPGQARQTALVGEWSLPGESITVAPKTHFFVRNPALGEDLATAVVEVYTWHEGSWYRNPFNVQVGDTIGSLRTIKTREEGDDSRRRVEKDIDFTTGALVLDLRVDEDIWYRRVTGKGDFTYSEGKALVLVYLDPADGQVKERADRLDRADPVYKRLRGIAKK